MRKKTSRLTRIILVVLLSSCAFSQLLGTFIGRPSRTGWVLSFLTFQEALFGLGGSYSFFTDSNYWKGESVSTIVKTKAGVTSLDDWLSPEGYLRARVINYHLLWMYLADQPSHLDGVAERIANFSFQRDPSLHEIEISQIKNALPRLGVVAPIETRTYHEARRSRAP